MLTGMLSSTACLAVLAIVSLCSPKLSAQSPGAATANAPHVEPLQMIVTYSDGREKRRESVAETVEPVGIRPGQEVTITLQRFSRQTA